MPEQAILATGGLICGMLAGMAAQYGRLCTFAAIEDVIAANDLRRARAFALSLAVGLASTQVLALSGFIDPGNAIYTASRIEVVPLVFGSILFGIGMALVGTCGFGLLVRAGAGDLRAVMMAVVLGIAAFAATGGPLSGVRVWLAEVSGIRLSRAATWPELLAPGKANATALVLSGILIVGLVGFALSSQRVRSRPKLLVAGVLLGAAVAFGWVFTGILADPFMGHRLESLTFVGPIGRVLLVIMGESIANAAFAVTSVLGVAAGSLIVVLARNEFRWEAFDDQREMRRHMLGATLMGIGGVMARGCTIGQGLSAFSLLSITAPIAILGMILGARIGLAYLIGRPALSRSKRTWTRNNDTR